MSIVEYGYISNKRFEKVSLAYICSYGSFRGGAWQIPRYLIKACHVIMHCITWGALGLLELGTEAQMISGPA